MGKIYLLYACDAWNSWASMRLLIASTNKKNIRAEIKRRIKSKLMEYDGEINTDEFEMIDRQLTYGYLNIVNNGERQ